jgi:hypothetical protein
MSALAFANTTLRTAQICAAGAFFTLCRHIAQRCRGYASPSAPLAATRDARTRCKSAARRPLPPRIPHSATG